MKAGYDDHRIAEYVRTHPRSEEGLERLARDIMRQEADAQQKRTYYAVLLILWLVYFCIVAVGLVTVIRYLGGLL